MASVASLCSNPTKLGLKRLFGLQPVATTGRLAAAKMLLNKFLAPTHGYPLL